MLVERLILPEIIALEISSNAITYSKIQLKQIERGQIHIQINSVLFLIKRSFPLHYIPF